MKKPALNFGPLIFLMVMYTTVMTASGCSSSSENQTSQTNQAEVVWGACPDYINTSSDAECAFVTVPKDYEKPYGGTIDVFIWRIKGSLPDDRKKGQVWFLQGGPGDSSVAFGNLLPPLAAAHPEWDYYSMDHRGTGNSNCLECPQAAPDGGVTPENAAACRSEVLSLIGGDLDDFNVTNAAKDLMTAIALTRGQGKVFVYGVSYGTYLVQRFMTLYPDSVDGTIIDSIVPSDSKPLDVYDSEFNNEGMQIMEQCSNDATCSSKLSGIAPDPWDAMAAVFTKIDGGQLCGDFAGISRKALRGKLAYLANGVYTRALVPAVIYRLNRCSDSDKAAIGHLFPDLVESDAAGEEFRPADKLYSSVLFTNITNSELYNGISPWAAQTIADAAYLSEDLVPVIAGIGYDRTTWPAYIDHYIGVRPDYSRPVLMMNSTVDGHTPLTLALGARQYLNRPYQYFITIPWAAHGVVFLSPEKGRITPAAENIGVGILFDFLSDPYTEPDTSGIADSYALEFSGTSVENIGASNYFFGMPDMWE